MTQFSECFAAIERNASMAFKSIDKATRIQLGAVPTRLNDRSFQPTNCRHQYPGRESNNPQNTKGILPESESAQRQAQRIGSEQPNSSLSSSDPHGSFQAIETLFEGTEATDNFGFPPGVDPKALLRELRAWPLAARFVLLLGGVESSRSRRRILVKLRQLCDLAAELQDKTSEPIDAPEAQ